jgi:glycosyltransferase involved in cell wall biosynthesis
MRVAGVIMAYNEEDVIWNAISYLHRGGCDVHVFDHGSEDQTTEIAIQAARSYPRIHYHYIDRRECPAVVDGYQAALLWNHIGRWVRSQIGTFDWIVWQAADELIREPDGRLLTVAGIEREAAAGCQVIRPLLRDFVLSQGDERVPYLQRLKNYRTEPSGHCPRAWQIDLTPAEIPIGLHIQDPETGAKTHPHYAYWPEGTIVSNNQWLLDHYRLRSVAQAERKARERDWIHPLGSKLAWRNPILAGKFYQKGPRTLETRDLEMP